MEHLLETNPEFCTTMDKLNELKKNRERYRKEKEELNERRKNAGMEPDFCSDAEFQKILAGKIRSYNERNN